MLGRNEYTEADLAPSVEMPKYKCHKEVWALKIKNIIFDWQLVKIDQLDRETDGSATITPVEQGYAPFKVDHAFVNKHFQGMQEVGGVGERIIGGYYVVYSDGYKSFSPAKAFEEGYTRV